MSVKSAGETPRALVHASAVLLGGAARPFGGPEDVAVLLLGDSGAGKSDLALRLIERGARLVSDDQTALFARDGWLFAECPPPLRGLIEIRGVGIVTLEACGPAPVGLAVRLATEAAISRLPEPAYYTPPPAIGPAAPVPLIVLHPFEASAPAKVAAAAQALAGATPGSGRRT